MYLIPGPNGGRFCSPTTFPITSIAEDNTGNIWVGSIFYVDRFDGKTWTAFDLRNYFSSTDTNIYVSSMMFDKQNTLWVTTSAGVVHFDGTNWTAYTVADGLADNYVSKIIEDKSDNIWYADIIAALTASMAVHGSHFCKVTVFWILPRIKTELFGCHGSWRI